MPKGIYIRTKRAKQVKQPKQVAQTVSLKEACEVLKYLVKDIKGLCITFDSNREAVEIMWEEEIFNAPVTEMVKVMECVKYLDERKTHYDFNIGEFNG